MIRRLACKATDILVQEGSAEEEDRELYEFGIEQGIWMGLNLVSAGFLGWITGEFLSCVVYLLSYIPVRRYAGGYHAGAYSRCWAGSSAMTLAVLLGIRFLDQPVWLRFSIFLLSAVLIICQSPVTVPNRPLSSGEKTLYRRKARKTAVLQMILAAISEMAGQGWIAECIMYSFLSLSCLMLLEIIRREK